MVEFPCICPAKPDGEPRHTTDSVELLPKLGFRAADSIKNSLAVMYVEDAEAGMAEILSVLREGYVLHGISSWTLVDDKGEPVPVTRGAVRSLILTDPDVAGTIADAADDLYQEAVMAPLVRLASTSSPPSQTEASTSAPTGSSEPPPTPSSPSSTTTSEIVPITRTSPSRGGGSNSSQNLASVG